jgi:F0F1-type ATP synthase membrane subunit c/vacuolar-type H+-ATPase subunit K
MTTQPLTSKQYLLTSRIIHGALVSGILLFNLVIGYLISQQTLGTGYNKQHEVFYLIVGLMALGSIFGGRVIFAKELEKAKTQPTFSKKLAGYQTANIIRYALIEGSALFSTVVTLLTLSVWFFVITAFLVVILASFFPTIEKAIKELDLNYNEQTLLQNPDAEIND